MISYTAAPEGLDAVEKEMETFKTDCLRERTAMSRKNPLHFTLRKARNEDLRRPRKYRYVARTGNFIDGGAAYNGALHILKVILVMITCGRISVSKAARMDACATLTGSERVSDLLP